LNKCLLQMYQEVAGNSCQAMSYSRP